MFASKSIFFLLTWFWEKNYKTNMKERNLNIKILTMDPGRMSVINMYTQLHHEIWVVVVSNVSFQFFLDN